MSDEEQELARELNEGGKAAFALVEHMRRMGADALSLPVIIEDEVYRVTVKHEPVEPAV